MYTLENEWWVKGWSELSKVDMKQHSHIYPFHNFPSSAKDFKNITLIFVFYKSKKAETACESSSALKAIDFLGQLAAYTERFVRLFKKASEMWPASSSVPLFKCSYFLPIGVKTT